MMMSITTSNLLRGTFILSSAIIISKLLGLIYLIPLKQIIGDEGVRLLLKGYIPYTVILSLATMGIPLAVSKYVAKYNSLGDYRRGKRLLRTSFYLLLITGSLATILVYFLAPLIVHAIKAPEALWPIRAASSALIIVPAMAVFRGYFQGWQSMGPTGVSQVFEQLIRVLVILISSIVFTQIGFSLVATVSIASLGAFCGAIAGMAVLLYYWFKRRKGIHQKVLSSPEGKYEPTASLYRELMRYSIPISFVSLALPLFQLIDWALYEPMLYSLGFSAELVISWFTILIGFAYKLIMIPVSLATAFALAIVPSVTQSFIQKEEKVLQDKIDQGMSILLYFIIPASVGLFILAGPLYYTMYGDFKGVTMLQWYTPAAIFMALYTLTAAILQGLHQTKWSVINLIVALLFKGASTPLFLLLLKENGAVLATSLGFAVGVTANLWIICRKTSWNIKVTGRSALKMMAASLLMGTVVYLSQWVLINVGINTTYVHYITQLLLGTVIGILVYIGLTWKMPWVHSIIGRWTKRKKLEAH
jgi:O-antigen/teichoic acid export membrane protein